MLRFDAILAVGLLFHDPVFATFEDKTAEWDR